MNDLTRLIAILILLTAVFAPGCGGDPANTTVSRGSPDIIGTVTAVETGSAEGGSGSLRVEVRKAEAPPDEYVIAVGADAPVYRQTGEELGDMGEVGFGALRSGQKVEIWLTGPVAESFPMQATAEFIVIAGQPGAE